MNLQEIIRRILREEIKMPLQLKRRVNNDILDELIYTVKSLIDSGYDESDAIYDTVRQFIASKQFKLNHDSEQSYWDSYVKVEEPLVDYVKSKLNIQESVLREEMGKNQNSQSDILSNLKNQDQEERREYQKFVQTKFNMDYEKGAKEYVKLKNRSFDDVFGDKERMEKFISINFNFDNFSDEDWENYWLMSQHADLYPNAQKSALQTISQYLGKNNDHYRYLYDRISCRETGVQKYGTQNICEKYSLDNIQESIRRILREETNPTLRRLLRRGSPENIDRIFEMGLYVIADRYIENKKKLYSQTLSAFRYTVINYVIVELCTTYEDVCTGGDFYEQISDFLMNNYSDRIKEKWEEINS